MNQEFSKIIEKAQPHPDFDWLLPTALVAVGYGCSEGAIRNQKSRHGDELLERVHWLKMPATNGLYKIFWTKRGVIRLGFFLETARAKAFRNFAESVVLGVVDRESDRQETQPPGNIVLSPRGRLHQHQNPPNSLQRFDAMDAAQGLRSIKPEVIGCISASGMGNSTHKHNPAQHHYPLPDELTNEEWEEYLPGQQQPSQQVMVVVNNVNNGDTDINTSLVKGLCLLFFSALLLSGSFLVVVWAPEFAPKHDRQEVSQ